jgi:glucose/arabinose dehydrogenase
MRPRFTSKLLAIALASSAGATIGVYGVYAQGDSQKTLTGKAALGDYTTDAPGVRRKITVGDIPKIGDSPSGSNGPKVVPRPDGVLPKAPQGFTVNVFVNGLQGPRVARAAPNGDIWVTEGGQGRVNVLRDKDGDGKCDEATVYAEGLNKPFGVAFYPSGADPKFVYIAVADGIVRYPYTNGDTEAKGSPEKLVSGFPTNVHWTRDIAFSKDGKTLFYSVGSGSNAWEEEKSDESRRARIFAFDPMGQNERVYATGIRNPTGIAVNPTTGDLWTTLNERENLGDNLPPDAVFRVKDGGFYGWPFYYVGGLEDPRHAGKKPELKSTVLSQDVLLGGHMAAMTLAFYTGKSFPREYQGDAFVALHGSGGRSQKTGYKVVRILQKRGVPTGEFEDFLTGFILPDGTVFGRPVGTAVGKDGALLVCDDANGTIYRVAYTGK